jgi:phenylalanine-4-hydroxylase
MADFEHVFDAPPPGAAPDWTISQNWRAYTEQEHATWDILYARQMQILSDRACRAFLQGTRALDLGSGGIPDLALLNPKLKALTGWEVVCVPGLVPDDVFFDHLANRRFVSGQFIRRQDQLDYLQEPDIFHDVFGHVPMLTDPDFANYMQAYGRGGQRARSLDMLPNLARLYWYTVEFGLIEEDDRIKLFGAGIVSSATESVFALEDASPNRLGFDLQRVMRTLYRIDDFQQTYFVISSLEALKAVTLQDFEPIYKALKGATEFTAQTTIPADRVFTKGSQTYAARGGRFAA